MNDVASNTRTYLEGRISFLKKQVKEMSLESPISGTLIHEIKGSISELQQTLNVLNGGKSVFQKVEELDHA